MFKIIPLPAFNDNYIWVLHNDNEAVLVDPGDAGPCLRFLEHHGLRLNAILATHHHGDHTGGIAELAARHPAPVYGPGRENIPGLTDALVGGEHLSLPGIGLELEVMATPGHTLDHLSYYGANSLFCGDTLFSCGCGRLFEGTPAMMMNSLHQLARLPDETSIYCAHEYTVDNMRFAKSVDPENLHLAEQEQIARGQRAASKPTLPSSIGLEKRINPFLRSREPALIAVVSGWLGRPPRNEVEVFSELRRAKDVF